MSDRQAEYAPPFVISDNVASRPLIRAPNEEVLASVEGWSSCPVSGLIDAWSRLPRADPAPVEPLGSRLQQDGAHVRQKHEFRCDP